MKGLKEYINESIVESGKYNKSHFNKDFNTYSGIINNDNKLRKCLAKLDAEEMIDDEDFINVLKDFTNYMGSSENMAMEDDENFSYEDIVERTPEWLINNIMDEYDEDAVPMYVSTAIDIWNSVAKYKIKYKIS